MTTARQCSSLVFALGIGFCGPLALAYSGRVPNEDAHIMGIVLTCVFLWATAWVPGYLVSLLYFFLAAVLTNAPTSTIFSGFASSAFWLVFSGGVIGFALAECGLSDRIGNALARRIGKSYARALCAFTLVAFALCLVMPSTFGRIAILVAIASGYCKAVGLDNDRPGRSGLLLLVIVGSFEIAGGVLPANLPNIVMSGVLEQSFDVHLSFADYLWTFLPAGVALRGIVLVTVSLVLFPDTIDVEPTGSAVTSKWSPHEIRVLCLLTLTLGLWFSDGIHHIAPGWVGLGFAIAYLLSSPRELVDRFAKSQKTDLLWFIAAIIGLTSLVHGIDLDFIDGSRLAPYLAEPFAIYVVLSLLSVGLCFLVTSNAAPALFSPIAIKLIGDPAVLKMGMLSQVLGYSTAFLPYQAPPIVFGIELAGLNRTAVVRYCLASASLGLLILVPANAVWWWVIGLMP